MCFFLIRSGRLCNLSISSVSLPSSSHRLCSLPHYSALVLVWSDPFLFSKTAQAYCALMQDAATKTMLIKGMKLNRLQRRALRHTPRRGALLPSKCVEVENGWGQTNCQVGGSHLILSHAGRHIAEQTQQSPERLSVLIRQEQHSSASCLKAELFRHVWRRWRTWTPSSFLFSSIQHKFIQLHNNIIIYKIKSSRSQSVLISVVILHPVIFFSSCCLIQEVDRIGPPITCQKRVMMGSVLTCYINSYVWVHYMLDLSYITLHKRCSVHRCVLICLMCFYSSMATTSKTKYVSCAAVYVKLREE